jgi:hypothetical protein
MVIWISYMMEERIEYGKACQMAQHFTMDELNKVFTTVKNRSRHGQSNIVGICGCGRNRRGSGGEGNNDGGAAATLLIA